MTEKAVAVESISQLQKILPKEFSRLYFGTETCERKIPSLQELEKAKKFCEQNRLTLSLATPFATDSGIKKLEPLLEQLSKEDELIVNDFGVLQLASDCEAEPVCGRLLNKQFRDPRIAFFENMPKEMMEHLSVSQASTKAFRKILSNFGVHRIELDNLLQGIATNLKGTGFKASLHAPLVFVAATRMCLLANSGKLSEIKNVGVVECNRECAGSGFSLKNDSIEKISIL